MGLLELITSRSARVAIVGGGYVGLPLAVLCAKVGFTTTVLDIDQSKVDSIMGGNSYIEDVSDADLKSLRSVDIPRLYATTSPTQALGDADIAIVCVQTPLNKAKEPDLSIILSAARSLRGHLPGGRLVILESTVYPGLTREVFKPALEDDCKRFLVAFSPERVDPGNKRYGIENTPKVVGGIDKESLDLAVAFYRQIVEQVVPVSSCDAAEKIGRAHV